jgi:4-amino-4-deoxy-L-arabinose transferase-like glycosyltransferase
MLKSLKNIGYILFGITIFRVFYLAINARPLNVDEAQYWLWSQHLNLGYHSKPPLIAYIIYITTHLFGNGYFGVRFIVPVCYLLIAYFLYLSAKKLFSNKEANWVALSFIFLPGVTFSATIISTDPLMMMFWALGLYFLICALKEKNLSYWILLGIAIGLSALAKYTGLVFLLSLLLYLIFCREVRLWLKSYKLYVMLITVGLILSPNIIWNIQHGFIAIKQVTAHNMNIQQLQFYPLHLLNFIINQLAVFSIILLPIYAYCVFQKKYWQDERLRLLWWFSLPMLLMIFITTFISQSPAHGNWTAAAYLSGIILVVGILVHKHALSWLRINLGYCLLVSLVLYSFDFGVCHQLITFKHYPKFYRTVFGWPHAGEKIKLLEQKYPQTNFIMSSRELWAKSVYFGRLPFAKVYSLDQKLDALAPINAAKQQNFILLTFQKTVPNYIKRSFKHVKKLHSIPLRQFGYDFNKIHVFYLTYFQGTKNE